MRHSLFPGGKRFGARIHKGENDRIRNLRHAKAWAARAASDFGRDQQSRKPGEKARNVRAAASCGALFFGLRKERGAWSRLDRGRWTGLVGGGEDREFQKKSEALEGAAAAFVL
jgi:hypothetical protein